MSLKRPRSVEEQLAALDKTAASGLFWTKALVWAVAVGCGVAALLFTQAATVIPAVFFAVVALAVHQTGPHLRRAARAVREGTSRHGQVEITVQEESESITYIARVLEPGQRGWRFDFIPLGWEPRAGLWPARIVTLSEVPWPVLVITDDGLAVPRYKPRPVPS